MFIPSDQKFQLSYLLIIFVFHILRRTTSTLSFNQLFSKSVLIFSFFSLKVASILLPFFLCHVAWALPVSCTWIRSVRFGFSFVNYLLPLPELEVKLQTALQGELSSQNSADFCPQDQWTGILMSFSNCCIRFWFCCSREEQLDMDLPCVGNTVCVQGQILVVVVEKNCLVKPLETLCNKGHAVSHVC